jgi:hypothetical protein
MATYCEQAAHGTSVYHGWGIPMVPGQEQCGARLSPDGVLELRIGAHSHGQGLETTLAQVAHEILGVDPDQVRLVHGDTALTPYSTGTWGSRCMVMSGGAVAGACREIAARVKNLAAHMLGVEPEALQLRDGGVSIKGSDRCVTLAEVAHLWYRQPQRLPPDANPAGLETMAGYKARVDTGTFSYACHAVAAAVDVETGHVELLDYVVVEDGGRLVNPMVVDGQVYGGTAQGIGTALYEKCRTTAKGSRSPRRWRTTSCRRHRDAAHADRAHGNAVAAYGIRAEGHRRRRGHRAAGCDTQCSERCPRAAQRRVDRDTDNATQGAGRHRGGAIRSALMKAAAFDYARPQSIREAVALLAGSEGARIIAGGQSLGPMLNLRLVQPGLLVDVRHIPELNEVRSTPDGCIVGSCVTHAAVEDGEVPDFTQGFMREVAAGIAYRAVRKPGHDRRKRVPCGPGGRLGGRADAPVGGCNS